MNIYVLFALTCSFRLPRPHTPANNLQRVSHRLALPNFFFVSREEEEEDQEEEEENRHPPCPSFWSRRERTPRYVPKKSHNRHPPLPPTPPSLPLSHPISANPISSPLERSPIRHTRRPEPGRRLSHHRRGPSTRWRGAWGSLVLLLLLLAHPRRIWRPAIPRHTRRRTRGESGALRRDLERGVVGEGAGVGLVMMRGHSGGHTRRWRAWWRHGVHSHGRRGRHGLVAGHPGWRWGLAVRGEVVCWRRLRGAVG